MSSEQMTWDLLPDNPMVLGIWKTRESYQQGELPVMRIFVGEIIENAGRKHVMKHVNNCDNSPWIPRWKESYHKTFNAIKNSR